MRGVQDTARPLRYVVTGFAVSAVLCPLLVYGWLGMPRLELAGSAVANLIGQWLAALMFCRALLVERVPLRIQPTVLRAQVVMGRDLLLRTLAFQACFVSAGAVAARFGAAAVAAHQVVLQLWSFLALVLDSLAIAAQSLVGAALGAGELAHAKSVAWRVTIFSAVASAVLAGVFAVGASVFPSVFTDDRSVLDAIGVPWWFMVAQLPVAGIVFALDGVLLGAGDAKFMRNATLISALVGFLPLIWLSLIFGWGLLGIWSGLSTFMVLRLVFVGWRAFSGRWLVPGTALDDIAVLPRLTGIELWNTGAHRPAEAGRRLPAAVLSRRRAAAVAASRAAATAVGSFELDVCRVPPVWSLPRGPLDEASSISASVRSRSQFGAGMNTGAPPSRATGLTKRRHQRGPGISNVAQSEDVGHEPQLRGIWGRRGEHRSDGGRRSRCNLLLLVVAHPPVEAGVLLDVVGRSQDPAAEVVQAVGVSVVDSREGVGSAGRGGQDQLRVSAGRADDVPITCSSHRSGVGERRAAARIHFPRIRLVRGELRRPSAAAARAVCPPA